MNELRGGAKWSFDPPSHQHHVDRPCATSSSQFSHLPSSRPSGRGRRRSRHLAAATSPPPPHRPATGATTGSLLFFHAARERGRERLREGRDRPPSADLVPSGRNPSRRRWEGRGGRAGRPPLYIFLQTETPLGGRGGGTDTRGEADRLLPGRSGLPSGRHRPAGGGEGEGEGRHPSPVCFHTETPPLWEGGCTEGQGRRRIGSPDRSGLPSSHTRPAGVEGTRGRAGCPPRSDSCILIKKI